MSARRASATLARPTARCAPRCPLSFQLGKKQMAVLVGDDRGVLQVLLKFQKKKQFFYTPFLGLFF